MHDRLIRVRRTVTAAPADLLVEELAGELAKGYAITETELLQVDFRLRALLPLRGGEPVTDPGHPAWRCFDHQAEVTRDGVTYLPVSMRGERGGVLRLAPAPTDPELRGELAEVATLLGHELAAVAPGTDRYTVAARTRRLTLAAEMQWDLLPGRCRIRPSFSLAGQLEPAYAVRGDGFDWSDDDSRVWLATVNGMGEGVAASLLTGLGVGALRNARRGGLGLADQAALADQAIYSHHGGEQYLAALLLELDLRTGVLTAVDAGSPRLVLLRDGELRPVALDAQFPLGMFDGTVYHTQEVRLAVGDRLLVVSDGVHEAGPTGPSAGEAQRSPRSNGPAPRPTPTAPSADETQRSPRSNGPAPRPTPTAPSADETQRSPRSNGPAPRPFPSPPSRYGDTALERFVRRTRSMAPLEVVRSLLGELRVFVGGDLADDAVAVCLDWTGPPAGSAGQ